MELPTQLLPGIAAALGLGLLIGIERERRKRDSDSAPRTAAGVRTHALLALCGVAAMLLGAWVLVIGALAVSALALASYLRSDPDDVGLTGEVAILLTYLLGALAVQDARLAVALGVLVAVLLASKEVLHRITRELISEQEMRDLLMLAAAALIVLPLLPDTPIDPWNVLRPAALGKLVVLIMAIGAAGHVALRLVGARWGLPVAGFFAGFASSTAATAGFGTRARETPALRDATVSAALFSNLASLLLFAIVIGSVAPALLLSLRWPLLGAALALSAVAAWGLWRSSRDDGSPLQEKRARAFRLSHALTFAAVVARVLLLSAWLHQVFGERGALIAAALAALAELHAATAGLAQLYAAAGIDLAYARWGVIALLLSSAISKTVLAFVSGGIAYGARVGAGLLAMLGAAVALMLLLPMPGAEA
jgi:uncharacterized membrane protein (DUF4010 family)